MTGFAIWRSAACGDLVGPILTFVIAGADKPRRVLKRDIATIAAVQLLAAQYRQLVTSAPAGAAAEIRWRITGRY